MLQRRHNWFGNRYVGVHHYFFFASFFDPRVKSMLKDMMTDDDVSKLKEDVLDLMVVEDRLAKKEKLASKKQSEDAVNERPSTAEYQSGAVTSAPAPSAPPPATARSHKNKRMFRGLNTTRSISNATEVEEGEDLQQLRDELRAELNKFHRESVHPIHNKDDSYTNPLD